MKKKNQNFSKKINSKIKKGFTLIEALVALFVFSILVTVIAGVYMEFLDAQIYAKNLQVRLENLQLSSNLISKVSRTSKLVIPATGTGRIDGIRLYDYSRVGTSDPCLDFAIDNAADLSNDNSTNFGVLKFSARPAADEAECLALSPLSPSSPIDMISLTDSAYGVSGGFFYRHAEDDVNSGLLVSSFIACDNHRKGASCEPSDSNAVRVQSSVSMKRD